MTEPLRSFDAEATAPPLSAAGRARRDQMLSDLTGEMRRTHAARRTRRILAVNTALLACIVGAVTLVNRVPQRSSPSGREIARDSAPSRETPAPVHPPIRIETVTTPAHLLDKYAAAPFAPQVQTMTDDELLTTLASLDRPTGMVRSGGRTWLTRNVADAIPATDPSSSS